ncbi:hypothetical protein [Streptomyces goshikiensis]|uniref:hypothetical protein n=1 Tax=Streptomyces goshikiensis TaxID=1942 RepID=UPI0033282AD9
MIATPDALGIEFRPTQTEVILTSRGPRIIETHLRTGGDELWNMVTDATGVDLIESQLRQVLGEKVLPGIRETRTTQTAYHGRRPSGSPAPPPRAPCSK